MNEQLKKMAAQCWEERLDGTHFNAEKFAKLIVYECIELCEQVGEEGLDGHYCVDRIRVQFDV